MNIAELVVIRNPEARGGFSSKTNPKRARYLVRSGQAQWADSSERMIVLLTEKQIKAAARKERERDAGIWPYMPTPSGYKSEIAGAPGPIKTWQLVTQKPQPVA